MSKFVVLIKGAVSVKVNEVPPPDDERGESPDPPTSNEGAKSLERLVHGK